MEQEDLKIILADARNAVILEYSGNPKELGSNESARTAKIDEACSKEVAAYREKSDFVTSLRSDIEITRLHLDHTRYQLRCSELACKVINQDSQELGCNG